MFINPKKPNFTLKCGFSLSFVTRYILAFILSSINILAHISAPIHIARHTFATMSLNNHVPLETISKMLGHSDIKTTQIYAKMMDKTISEDMEVMRTKFNGVRLG